MKKVVNLLFLCTIFSMSFLRATTEEELSKFTNKWFPQKLIQESLNEYFDCFSLSPYVDVSKDSFIGTFLKPLSHNENNARAFWMLQPENQDSSPSIVFFMDREKTSDDLFLRPFYIMKEECMSPVLFVDIMHSLASSPTHQVANEILAIPGSFVYIENEWLTEGNSKQIWTFYTPEREHKAIILLSADERGGTDFVIANLNNTEKN